MRRFEKAEHIQRMNENLNKEPSSLTKTSENTKPIVSEEIYDLNRDLISALGRGFTQKDAEEYLSRPLSNYEAYELFGVGDDGVSPEIKTYENNLTSQSSKFAITAVRKKTGKATLVSIKELESNTTKKMWVPNSQIKGNVVPAWIIKKNF